MRTSTDISCFFALCTLRALRMSGRLLRAGREVRLSAKAPTQELYAGAGGERVDPYSIRFGLFDIR